LDVGLGAGVPGSPVGGSDGVPGGVDGDGSPEPPSGGAVGVPVGGVDGDGEPGDVAGGPLGRVLGDGEDVPAEPVGDGEPAGGAVAVPPPGAPLADEAVPAP